jgi:L-ascorbate metabolism protein UlaG (beta-lactamase superfamily)
MLTLLVGAAGLAIVGLVGFVIMQQAPFGKNPDAARLERMKKSSHYVDGAFQNSSPTAVMAEGASYLGATIDYFAKSGTEPPAALPSVKRDLQASPPAKPSMTWFGHSTLLLQINGKNILIDPVFSERASPVQWAGSKSYAGTMVYVLTDLPPIDAVVITHDHYDHLDYSTIVQIVQLAPRVGKFYVPLGVGAHLASWGVAESSITELDWWDAANIAPDMKLIATPARHFSGRGLTTNKTLWAAFALLTPEHRIYIGGDSGYDTHFKEIGDKYGPFDIAFLEAGQYNKNWPQIHMMPEETVQASLDLKAKVLLPIHWGRFTLGLHPWDEPIRRIARSAEARQVRISTPMIGEQVIIDSVLPNKQWWQDVR